MRMEINCDLEWKVGTGILGDIKFSRWCICVFVYLCICVFVYFCICEFMYLCNFYLCDLKSWNGDSRRDKNVMVMSSSATVSVFATSPQIDRPVLYCIVFVKHNTNTTQMCLPPLHRLIVFSQQMNTIQIQLRYRIQI